MNLPSIVNSGVCENIALCCCTHPLFSCAWKHLRQNKSDARCQSSREHTLHFAPSILPSLTHTISIVFTNTTRQLGGPEAVALAGGENNLPPVHYAADKGHAECLRVLGEYGGETACKTFTTVSKDGDTPAITAARNNFIDCLDVLGQYGGLEALGTSNRTDGWKPAHFAASLGHSGCLEVLAKHGASASFSSMTKRGFTPAILAARKGHFECLRVIVEHSDAQGLAWAMPGYVASLLCSTRCGSLMPTSSVY